MTKQCYKAQENIMMRLATHTCPTEIPLSVYSNRFKSQAVKCSRLRKAKLGLRHKIKPQKVHVFQPNLEKIGGRIDIKYNQKEIN